MIMNKMLKMFRLAFLIIVSAMLGVSCTDGLEYVKGEPEHDNTYGVYFPEHMVSPVVQLSPEDKHEVRYIVKRTNTADAISVPVTVTESEKGIFIVGEIWFDEGEDETELVIAFPKAKSDGTEYSITVSIDDPEYVSIYSKKETALSLTVSVAKWVDVVPEFGQAGAKWRDDILSSMYSGLPNPNAEAEVSMQEREDKKGLYRVRAYTLEMMRAIFDAPYATENKYIVIDATDPDKVWIPKQEIGVTLNSDDGFITVASYVDKQFSIDESDSMYGTLDDNGVITFPIGGVMCNLSKAFEPDEWYNVNQSGMLRLMLPGATLFDYSASLVNLGMSEAGSGVMSVSVTLGKDVKDFRYKVFEGTLDDGTASLNAQDMSMGLVEADGVTSGGTIEISGYATGKYTLVGYVTDADGNMKDYAFLQFGFIGAGDDKTVDLTVGLEGTNEFAGQGLNPDNSVKLYAYGNEVTDVTYWLYLTEKYTPEEAEELLEKKGTKLTEEQIQKINDKEFSVMIPGLNGNSHYTLLVRAGNGYGYRIFRDNTYRTGGLYNPVMGEYVYSDLKKITDEAYLLGGKTWNYYATDRYDRNPMRKRMPTTVRFEKIDGQLLMFGFTGLKFDLNEDGTSSEVGIPMTFKDNYLYMDVPKNSLGLCEGKPVYIQAVPDESMENIYTGITLMVIGRVSDEDGYLYFTANPAVTEEASLTFSNIVVKHGQRYVSWLMEMLLADSSKDMTGRKL